MKSALTITLARLQAVSLFLGTSSKRARHENGHGKKKQSRTARRLNALACRDRGVAGLPLRLNNLIRRQYCELENLLLGDLRKTRFQEFLDNMGTELGN